MKAETQETAWKPAAFRSFKIGEAIVNPKRMTVTIGDSSHQLTDLTWRFLQALVKSSPEIVKYDDLALFVWRQEHVSDETLAQRVRQLRQIFDDNPQSPSYIRTARGVGYQLVADVQELPRNGENPVWKNIFNIRYAAIIFGVISITAMSWLFSMSKSQKPRLPSSQTTVAELLDRADDYRGQAQAEANEASIKLYQKVLDTDETNLRATIGLSFSLAHKSSKFGQSHIYADQAARLADKAILINSSSAGAFAARGMADDARGRVSSAMDYYKKSLQLNNGDQSIRSSTAYLLQVQGHYHDALRLEIQALENAKPTYFSDYQIAIALGRVGFQEAAKTWLERAVLLRPDIIYLSEYRARELIKTGQVDDAAKLLSRNSNPRSESFILKSIAHSLNDEPEMAKQSIQEAFTLANNHGRDCYECIAIFSRRESQEYSAKIKKLIAGAEEAIRDGDEWPEYRIQLAYVQLASGRSDEALQSIAQAHDLGYRDWKWLETTPLLYELHGDSKFEELTEQMKIDLDQERRKITSDQRLASLF